MEDKKYNYIGRVVHALKTLLTGMKVTFIEFFTKKVTERYPENRAELKMFDRFRGTLTMPHDAAGKNKCIACTLCEINCPNETIKIETISITDEDSGKKKKKLLYYRYDLGSCLFCQLCVNVCPTKAIEFDTEFEHAVFNRDKLVFELNKDIDTENATSTDNE